ncbi:serine hydrolase [Martelella radicis]|uniref:Beta-lactamase class A n=1 Tax=Martelella radicis TaxID=1397476 RepID=A0A7W6KIE7_9HYPH|nr:serine hydrolase [Martelella radicis]MBB4121893.1 beta-lactamase class A [Martelella radicis]
MTYREIIAAGAIAVLATAPQALASPAEINAIETLWQNPEDAGVLVSESFARAVPNAQLTALVDRLVKQTGPALAVTGDKGAYMIRTETHEIPVEISLDDDGRIQGLFFSPPEVLTEGPAATLAAFEALPGTVSYLVTSEDKTLFDRNADTPLAVASAFKLGVLKVLLGDIAAQNRNWQDVVTLQPEDKSLPSGRLQTFPDGSPVTLHTLATLMIAESDNTATDMLMRVLGADRVANALGLPSVLTTRQAFALKADPELAQEYAAASETEKPATAKKAAAGPLPAVSDVLGPMTTGVEWPLSNAKLCALMGEVATADVFSVNPGPVRAGDWKSVAFKGGSETGVLNLTAQLTGKDEGRVCLSVTINDAAAIDETKAAGLFTRLAHQLATSGK